MTAPPAWLQDLMAQVSQCAEAHSPFSSFGYRYAGPEQDADEGWEVIVYPTPVQLSGGDADGVVVDPGFSLDLEPLRRLFDEILAFTWIAQPFDPADDDTPAVVIEGRYQGQTVLLTIQAYAPADEPPVMTLDITAEPGRLH